MGVLLVSLWGSAREDVVVGVGGGGGFGREEWGWFFLDCWGLILRWVLWVFNLKGQGLLGLGIIWNPLCIRFLQLSYDTKRRAEGNDSGEG